MINSRSKALVKSAFRETKHRPPATQVCRRRWAGAGGSTHAPTRPSLGAEASSAFPLHRLRGGCGQQAGPRCPCPAGAPPRGVRGTQGAVENPRKLPPGSRWGSASPCCFARFVIFPAGIFTWHLFADVCRCLQMLSPVTAGSPGPFSWTRGPRRGRRLQPPMGHGHHQQRG